MFIMKFVLSGFEMKLIHLICSAFLLFVFLLVCVMVLSVFVEIFSRNSRNR